MSELQDQVRARVAYVKGLEAEIERLRAALREIADMPPLIQYAGVEGKQIVYDAEQRIARKALSNEQNGDDNG